MPLTSASPMRLRPTRFRHIFSTSITARNSSTGASDGELDVENLVAQSAWSAASLLPPKDQPHEVTSKQLHHLLRLSALPPPKDAAEEQEMLTTLSSQLHFVKVIQNTDTAGVAPLQSLRDETVEGRHVAELDMEALMPALENEEVRGMHHKRIKRKQTDPRPWTGENLWDPLGSAGKTVGKYFIVEGGKET